MEFLVVKTGFEIFHIYLRHLCFLNLTRTGTWGGLLASLQLPSVLTLLQSKKKMGRWGCHITTSVSFRKFAIVRNNCNSIELMLISVCAATFFPSLKLTEVFKRNEPACGNGVRVLKELTKKMDLEFQV